MKIKNTIVKDALRKNKTTALFIAGISLVVSLTFVTPVGANLQQQIDELRAQNSEKQEQRGGLEEEAVSLEDKIQRLQQQIGGLQRQINENEAKIADLRGDIAEAEAELDKQRELLGRNIRAMYVEGDISTLEMLASSKDLSEFIDRQQYRNSVKDNITATLDRIHELRHQLKAQEETLEKRLVEQQGMRNQLAEQRNENNRLLSLNVSEQQRIDEELRENSERITELQRQQAILNARLMPGTISSSSSCGGGYPGSTPGPIGANWGCNHPISNTIDNWGMYNRQCVSYTAFKVAASGRHMPYWGGHGNANRWPANARNMGIPVNSTPKVGSVAVSMAGFYGHTMYVEHVYGDGTILISEFNYDWQGTYTERRISASGLQFIHF